ncbi:HAD-IIA family hydrolase [Treponema sp. OMZ 840]|uniref:HAD-IIA family hydrolase n=1 Tax=Treponema sp. OMZ 840 TaxID=244313 RepID=UPI003D8A5BC9
MLNQNNPEDIRIFNQNIDRASLVKSCKHFVLDMDGTFYLGNTILPGSLDFLKTLEDTGRDYLFFTNNSSKSPDVYIKKLARMGCHISRNQIMTSGDVTIEYLNAAYPGKSVYLVGTEALIASFREGGINLVEKDPEIVVIGFDTTLTYEKIVKASDYVRAGAIYLATHPDINCPVENGYITDVGAFCAMISLSAGGAQVKSLGKPNPETVEMAMLRAGWKTRSEIAFVGDRLYTDIAVGVRNGARGLLVLTGEASMDDVKKSDTKPDAIFEDLREIGSFLR